MATSVETTGRTAAHATTTRGPASSRPHDLTKGPIAKTLMLFSLPMLGSSVLQSLNGTVNSYWVSRLLGTSAITAIGNANVVMMLLLGAVAGIGMAANILVAQSFGARNVGNIKKVMGTAAVFFVLLSASIAVLGYLLAPRILSLMGTPQPSVVEAENYLRIVFLSMPFLYFFNFLQMAQRGIGDSRTPFYFMLLAVVIDVVLNPILISGAGPFPRLGIAGAATSTFVAQGVSLAGLLAFLYRHDSVLVLGWSERAMLVPDPGTMRVLVTRGLPMGLQMLVMSGSALVMIGMVNGYGVATSAAYTASTQIWSYVQMPAMALGATISSMAAQNIGAGQWPRVDRIARIGTVCALGVTGLLVVALYGLGDASLALFLPPRSPALLIAHHINAVVLWSFALYAVTFALSGVVRATGTVWPSLAILAISMFAIRVPVAQLLRPGWGADAIWWSFPLGIIASGALSILYFRFGRWREVRLGGVQPVGEAGDAGHAAPAVGAAA